MTEVSSRLCAPSLAALIAASCAPAVSSVPPAQPACVVVDEWARPRITIATGAMDPVLHAAAIDRTYPAIAAAQVFETLIRTDCTGAAVASLAADWTPRAVHPADDVRAPSTEWRFLLRQGATFSDGAPVDAAAVVAAWGARDTGLLAAVTAVGGHDLRVVLRVPATAGHFALRSHVLARTDGGFIGTGPYTVVTDSEVTGSANAQAIGQAVRLIRRTRGDTPTARAIDGASPDTIDVRVHRDLRTALDAQVDALVTGDPAVLAYARAIGAYAFVPLPWTRTWVLATSPLLTAQPPARSDPGDDPAETFPASVVGTDVRLADAPFWWDECGPATTAAPRGETDGRVLYAQDDAVGRVIAERIAALAHDRAPQWLRAVMVRPDRAARALGVSAADLASAIRTGSALAVVTALPRVQHGCGAAGSAYDALLRRWHVTPLLDSRDHLVHRPGIGRVHVDGDGMIRFGAR